MIPHAFWKAIPVEIFFDCQELRVTLKEAIAARDFPSYSRVDDAQKKL
jgi:hypothetical protein